ncbi:Hypothetical predicted protein [Marmota monax]|uniref:Uncharacterized protein n=1 Tax=Marmota monax TaxID=9995 RepID=A0A5E4APC3_MARMO|nr:Hypothetical predicted protein [Marmota monax]
MMKERLSGPWRGGAVPRRLPRAVLEPPEPHPGPSSALRPPRRSQHLERPTLPCEPEPGGGTGPGPCPGHQHLPGHTPWSPKVGRPVGLRPSPPKKKKSLPKLCNEWGADTKEQPLLGPPKKTAGLPSPQQGKHSRGPGPLRAGVRVGHSIWDWWSCSKGPSPLAPSPSPQLPAQKPRERALGTLGPGRMTNRLMTGGACDQPRGLAPVFAPSSLPGDRGAQPVGRAFHHTAAEAEPGCGGLGSGSTRVVRGCLMEQLHKGGPVDRPVSPFHPRASRGIPAAGTHKPRLSASPGRGGICSPDALRGAPGAPPPRDQPQPSSPCRGQVSSAMQTAWLISAVWAKYGAAPVACPPKTDPVPVTPGLRTPTSAKNKDLILRPGRPPWVPGLSTSTHEWNNFLQVPVTAAHPGQPARSSWRTFQSPPPSSLEPRERSTRLGGTERPHPGLDRAPPGAHMHPSESPRLMASAFSSSGPRSTIFPGGCGLRWSRGVDGLHGPSSLSTPTMDPPPTLPLDTAHNSNS